ncbi:hypothetical protein ACF0H5_018205 [Mactra antiquata]
MSDVKPVIPVIDFEKLSLSKGDDSILRGDLEEIGGQIKEAFQTIGFCYLKNHGTDGDLIENYFKVSRDFFCTSPDEKAKFARSNDCNFGWVALERERINPERPGDLKEAFNYQPGINPDTWPSSEFKTLSQDFYASCKTLSLRICDALSVGLGLDEKYFRDAHKFIGVDGNPTTLRTLYYPPLPEVSSIKPGQIRLGEHSDYGTITMLFQDEIGGLEVEEKGTGFVPATPIPGTVILNIGDLMQRWTSDFLVATKHRVCIPEVEFKRKSSRQSVAFFVHPDDEYVIKCLDGSNKYEPISSIDYLNYRFSVTF